MKVEGHLCTPLVLHSKKNSKNGLFECHKAGTCLILEFAGTSVPDMGSKHFIVGWFQVRLTLSLIVHLHSKGWVNESHCHRLITLRLGGNVWHDIHNTYFWNLLILLWILIYIIFSLCCRNVWMRVVHGNYLPAQIQLPHSVITCVASCWAISHTPDTHMVVTCIHTTKIGGGAVTWVCNMGLHSTR